MAIIKVEESEEEAKLRKGVRQGLTFYSIIFNFIIPKSFKYYKKGF